ncbi:MAG: hypothetical protein OQK71_04740 [Desulfobacter sp.]|nr:hypothetical protein [Desulfobacter sp.]
MQRRQNAKQPLTAYTSDFTRGHSQDIDNYQVEFRLGGIERLLPASRSTFGCRRALILPVGWSLRPPKSHTCP